MNVTKQPMPPRGKARGFSLIEVTIAIAVIAAALIPLIALLPSGMETMRKGYRAATEAEIVRVITSELTMSDWNATNDLADWDGELRYYDKDGVRLDEDKFTAFTVQLEVPTSFVSLPGGAPNNYLRSVQIKITNLPSVVSDRFTNESKHNVHSALVVKMDKQPQPN